MDKSVVIIGAGLCGSLLGVRLAQRGYQVAIYEERPDLRKTTLVGGRSINLAFSARGIQAFEMVGLADKAKELCIPMYGREIHDLEGSTFFSSYSSNNDFINSVSRADLNTLLLDELENYDNVSLHFNSKCIAVDIERNKIKLEQNKIEKEVAGDILLGTDGVRSALRKAREAQDSDFRAHQKELTHGYKELIIPSKNGGFQIKEGALHIWPRGNYMLIALANLDGSFTVTLFLEKEGVLSFESLDSEVKLEAFFKEQFPDALELMPNLSKEFFRNPTGVLGTVKCGSWGYKKQSLLLGDAAHAIVPFYGQGMNASFEDVFVLDKYLDEYNDNWEQVIPAFVKERKQDADAIADLALENFYEMRDHVANADFQIKRQVEMQLESQFDYYSKYALVTFKPEIPYHKAKLIGNKQDEVLLDLVKTNQVEELSLEAIYNKIKQATANL